MALRILGIDLGTHAVKVAELRSSFRSLELVSLQRARVASADPYRGATLDEQLAALASLGQGGPRPDVVVVSLPGAGAATHRLSFPFADPRRLEQTLGFEVEGQILFDLADVRYDYEVLSQRSGRGNLPARTEVLVGVIRREIVSALLTGLNAQGLDRASDPAGPRLAAIAAAGPGGGCGPRPGSHPHRFSGAREWTSQLRPRLRWRRASAHRRPGPSARTGVGGRRGVQRGIQLAEWRSRCRQS